MKWILIILALVTMTMLNACNNGRDDGGSRVRPGGANRGQQKTDANSYSFNKAKNKDDKECDIKKTFTSKELMCEGLQLEKFNEYCAQNERKLRFTRDCAGTFTAKEESEEEEKKFKEKAEKAEKAKVDPKKSKVSDLFVSVAMKTDDAEEVKAHLSGFVDLDSKDKKEKIKVLLSVGCMESVEKAASDFKNGIRILHGSQVIITKRKDKDAEAGSDKLIYGMSCASTLDLAETMLKSDELKTPDKDASRPDLKLSDDEKETIQRIKLTAGSAKTRIEENISLKEKARSSNSIYTSVVCYSNALTAITNAIDGSISLSPGSAILISREERAKRLGDHDNTYKEEGRIYSLISCE